MSGYLGELRQNMRPLLAASLATGTSLPLYAYTNSIFAPHLIEEFGWSRAQFALIGLTMLATLLILPFVGRFTDKLGVRRVALVGTLLMPLGFLGYATMQGSFTVYLVIFTAILMIGSMTGPLVFTRLIAANFDRSQGLALTVVNCAPSLLALLLAPALNLCIEAIGWRASYLVLGAFVLVCGIAAILLIGQEDLRPAAAGLGEPAPTAKADYATILKSQVFWVLVFAFFLCLLQTPLHSAQMNLMLLDNGLSMQTAANIVPVYAAGTIVGRILCGIALDHWSTRAVTVVSMGIPAFGFLMLGSDMNTLPVIGAAMFLIGVSVGAESDLICFLVARYFKLRIYGTTLALVHSATFLSSAVGGIGISLTLTRTDSFTPFLFIVAGTITVGCLLFLLLPKGRSFARIG